MPDASSLPLAPQLALADLPLLSTQDVVQILQISASTVDRWAKAGRLPVAEATLGGKRKFRLADVLALQSEFRQKATGELGKPRMPLSGRSRPGQGGDGGPR
jgi:excisionase family DNA binding protein